MLVVMVVVVVVVDKLSNLGVFVGVSFKNSRQNLFESR